jgi:hypothetical protein
MATYTKFNQFVSDLLNGKHALQGGSPTHTLKLALTNTAPNAATGAVFADITEIAAGNGYAAGGASAANVSAASAGTETVTGTNITWTASGGTIGPFRYCVLYNVTQTTPVKPLVAYWDYGSSLTLNSGDSFTVKFNNGSSSGTIFTLA